MWREGLNADLIAWLLNLAALTCAMGLGARALLNAKIAARLALGPSFAGALILAHLAAFAFSFLWIVEGGYPTGLCALGAAAALSAAWFGAAAGRGLSMLRARTYAASERRVVLLLIVFALLIGAPWITWTIGLSD
jgi:hypothetical protein